MKPKVVVFDVIETLFALEPLEEKLKAGGLRDGSLQVWFPRLLRDAFALEVSGEYKTFREVARATLEVLMSEQNIDPARSTIDEIINGFANLPAHPDVKPALEILRDAGVRIVALTNGSPETTKKMFVNAGLETFIERYISIDEVKHWKPAREVYLYAANMLDIDPAELALIATHDWDIQGAKRAGFVTGFIQRKAAFSPAMGEPNLSAATLQELAENLLRLS